MNRTPKSPPHSPANGPQSASDAPGLQFSHFITHTPYTQGGIDYGGISAIAKFPIATGTRDPRLESRAFRKAQNRLKRVT